MSQSTAAMITCRDCGRAFAWKPAIAGKKGKCSCGQVLSIPAAPPVPPPPPAEDDLDALYEMAEPAPDVLPAPPPVYVPRPAPSLAYAPPPKEEIARDSLTDPVRDIYVPTGLLVVGFLTILIGVTQRYDWPPTMLAVVSLIQGAITAVKTLIIIGLAIVVAPALGISFGLLRTAVLKFAGILIFTDAALLLLEFLMEWTGALTPGMGRRGMRGVGWVNLMAAAAIISVLTHYLFDMDSEETGKVAIPMAVASRLIEIGMNLLLIFVILPAIFAPNAANAPAAAAGPTPGQTQTQTAAAGGQSNDPTGAAAAPTAPPANMVRVVETAEDQAIGERVAKKSPLVQNALESRDSLTSVRGMRALLDGCQASGAQKIYVDREGSKRLAPAKAYIELPTTAEARAACYSVASSVCQTYGHQLQPAADGNQRYLTVVFKEK